MRMPVPFFFKNKAHYFRQHFNTTAQNLQQKQSCVQLPVPLDQDCRLTENVDILPVKCFWFVFLKQILPFYSLLCKLIINLPNYFPSLHTDVKNDFQHLEASIPFLRNICSVCFRFL